MDKIFVRKAAAGDVPAIAAIERKSIPEPWSEGAFYAALENEKAVTLAALRGDVICGFITGVYLLDTADIYSIAVSEECRGRGIGERLLREFFGVLPSGVERVCLEVRESNFPALELYKKVGFEPVGMRKNFYREPRENAVLMTKIL